MARDKQLEAHMQGMAHALKIVSEQGIDALEKELKMRGMYRVPITVPVSAVEKAKDTIWQVTYRSFLILTCVSLADEFGFEEDELNRFVSRMNMACDYVSKGYAYFEDYANALAEQMEIHLEVGGLEHDESNEQNNGIN